jgi:hypothetical protein
MQNFTLLPPTPANLALSGHHSTWSRRGSSDLTVCHTFFFYSICRRPDDKRYGSTQRRRKDE